MVGLLDFVDLEPDEELLTNEDRAGDGDEDRLVGVIQVDGQTKRGVATRTAEATAREQERRCEEECRCQQKRDGGAAAPCSHRGRRQSHQ